MEALQERQKTRERIKRKVRVRGFEGKKKKEIMMRWVMKVKRRKRTQISKQCYKTGGGEKKEDRIREETISTVREKRRATLSHDR